MEKVRVELGERSYDILIEEDLTKQFREFVSKQNYSKKAAIISDSNVLKYLGKTLNEILHELGFETIIHELPAGESSKNLAEAEKIFTRLIENHFDRRSLVIALGGGVVGDLAGFVAATYLRGIPFIQMPTTLLAQVDSSVGGKVAVNHRLCKNSIGAFYQPQLVIIDLNFIKTLPEREIRAGFAEIIKYGIIRDADFFEMLETATDIDLGNTIARSCEIKADVVSHDEKESGLRRIVNFGHTIGHAIEEETHYERFVHGEAVGIGMVAATRISKLLGNIDDETEERIFATIEKFGLPVTADNTCDPEKLYQALLRDKKVVNGKINWVVIKKIGEVYTDNKVPEEIVREAIDLIL